MSTCASENGTYVGGSTGTGGAGGGAGGGIGGAAGGGNGPACSTLQTTAPPGICVISGDLGAPYGCTQSGGGTAAACAIGTEKWFDGMTCPTANVLGCCAFPTLLLGTVTCDYTGNNGGANTVGCAPSGGTPCHL
jgi:hypothetical protein